VGLSGFGSSETFPLNRNAVPEHFYSATYGHAEVEMKLKTDACRQEANNDCPISTNSVIQASLAKHLHQASSVPELSSKRHTGK
jgi:hypothetical protein